MDKNPVCPNLAKKSLKGPKNGVFGVLTKIKANVLFIVKSEKSHGPLSFCENHMSGKRGRCGQVAGAGVGFGSKISVIQHIFNLVYHISMKCCWYKNN